MAQRVDVVVVGAGQAGLALSYHLAQQGRPHVVLERGRVGEAWRSGRWDSFCLVTPNWMTNLPGFPYAGDDPDGFMGRDEVVAFLERYAASFGAPVREGVEVTAVAPAAGGRYLVETTAGPIEAVNVAVATNFLQVPKLPPFAADLPGDIVQVHTSRYRNPEGLPPGAVLVVGTGQSGSQVAEELYQSGRRVCLSVGRTGRVPRRYRGKDVYWWVRETGIRTTTAETSAGHAHVSAKDGGRDLSLHRFARDGVALLGRVEGVAGGRLRLSPDLHERLAYADAFEAAFKRAVDDYVARTGLDAAPDEPPVDAGLGDGDRAEVVRELDLRAAGVSSVVWGTGYGCDLRWVRLPAVGADGFPVHERGITPVPGLYVVGMSWKRPPTSAFVGTVGQEAAHVSAHLAASTEAR